MDSLLDFFRYLTNSQEIIQTGGLVLVTIIVFAENGLFFAFFLPGDYLLFLTGVFCGTGQLPVALVLLLSCLFGAAVVGSMVGYLSGRYFGEQLQSRPDSIFFKKKNIETTRLYFDKYGARVLILSRFLPVVRTFAPILSGIIRMKLSQFTTYNVLGGALWVLSLTGGGYFFGERFPWIVDYVHWVILFFLAVTTFTVVRGYVSARKDAKEEVRKKQEAEAQQKETRQPREPEA